MKHSKILSLGLLLLSFLSFPVTYAADFNTLPVASTLGVKQEALISIKIDSGGETINAAQVKLKFNPDVLEVKSISKDGSIFNFWLQEPKFSNTDGVIDFIAGTTNGVSGASLQVLQITFATKGIGSSDISFTDASIVAADGSGTNILSKANGAKFTVTSAVAPISATSVSLPNTGLVPAPVQIIRKPIQVTGLPVMPSVSVILYPSSADWYNFVSQFTASWRLPPDIFGLSTALNTNPNFVVPPVSEGLFESKTLPEISTDGIYYFHIRFQNNKGWGPTAHYRISVDTQPPLPFKIDVITGLVSDNPSPILSFRTGDALSGVDSYAVKINGEEPVIIKPGDKISSEDGKTVDSKVSNRLEVVQTNIGYLNVRDTPSVSGKLIAKVNPGESYTYSEEKDGWYKISGLPADASAKEGWVIGTYTKLLNGEGTAVTKSDFEYKISPHELGAYIISVLAVDKAGNRIEDKINIEILPIETPQITSISQKVIIGTDEHLVIKGLAALDTNIIVTIQDKNKFLIIQDEAVTNPQGEWEFSLDKDLRRGDYFVSVKARDSRGAQSLPTESIRVQFVEKPIISLFGFDITLRWLLVILISAIILGSLWFYRKTFLHLARAQRESIIINRDIRNAFDTVKGYLDKIPGIVKKKSSVKTKAMEVNDVNKKIKDTLDKIEEYSSKDIEGLK